MGNCFCRETRILKGQAMMQANRASCTFCALTGCHWCPALTGGRWPMTMPYRAESIGSWSLKAVRPFATSKRFIQDDHYGLSPLQAAASAIDVHNSASRWSKALLDNAARPSGAIIYKGENGQASMSADQYDRLLNEMETYHQGARNAGRPMLLEGGLDWRPMGFSPADMEFQKSKEAAAREIAVAFGVPPMLLGIPGDATYANYQEANRALYRLTVLPLVSKVTASIAHWLSEMQGEVVEMRPDLDQIPALATERDAQWRRIAGSDFLTKDEKRRLLGLPVAEALNEEGE